MSDARKKWLSEVATDRPARDVRLLDRASAQLEANILQPVDGKPLPWSPLRGISPSPVHYKGIWNWDSAFHAMTVARWDQELSHEQVSIFLDRQQPSGLLPDVIRADGSIVTNFGKPPVFPWACIRLDELNRVADMDFLRCCYEHFKPYEAFWRRERGGDAEGLFHYDSAVTDPAQREKEAKFESGWDTSVRWDAGAVDIWPVDLNCYMVMLYQALEEMAHLLELDDQDEWFDRGQALTEKIDEALWVEELGAYCDVRRSTGEPTGVLSPASFMPLFIGGVRMERAERVALLAADSSKFFPGMPTVSYDNPAYSSSDYWRGPTWLNTAWLACKALRNYGFRELTDAIKDTILDWCDANTDTIYEYYDSRTGKGLGAPQFGWSAAFIIEFILDW